MSSSCHSHRGVAACLLGALALAVACPAQNARFTGQITDPNNAVINHATVEVTNEDSGVEVHTETDGSGSYTLPYLPAGHYRIVVQAPGFNVSAQRVTLDMGQTLIFNVQLTVGDTQTTVTVKGNSELTELHTDSAEVSGTITGKEVAGIQLNGRNFTQLIALAPGVSNQTQQDEARVGMAGSVAFSVNGGRTEYNSFQVDGSETLNVGINRDHSTLIVYPSIDAIQEIKVLTSNYGAMYPSTGNGTTIVTTKSGTDNYHGSLYEFFRNEALNAKGYFDVGNQAPLYRRNDFGGTIGGPLSIPHVYDARGKSHFFFSEEFRLEKDPYAYRQAVPSPAERNGDFSDVCPAVANGTATSFSRASYPDCPDAYLGQLLGNQSPFTFINNQITYPGNNGAYINPNATALLGNGIIPLPNASSGCNSTGSSCYLADVALPTYWREELLRIDHAVTSKHQLSVHYIHDEWKETTPAPQYAYTQNTLPTIQNDFYAPGMSVVARLSSALTTSLLNEFTASFTNSNITLTDLPASATSLVRPAILDEACTSGAAQCGMTTIFANHSSKIPGVAIAGNNSEYGGLGFAVDPGYMPWQHSNPTYSFTDNVEKILRHHNMQFGAQWVIFQRNQTNGPIGAATGDTQGLLTFSNIRVAGSTGNAFADYLFGQTNSSAPPGGYGAISSFQQDSAQARYRQRYQIVEPYFQDDFKPLSRLTINLGIRLSLFGTYYEAEHSVWNWQPSAFSSSVASSLTVDGQGGLRDPITGDSIPIYTSAGGVNPLIINGLVQCGKNGVPQSCMSGHVFNPSPRIGFAWDPTGGGKTAIRGGYGIFFEHGTADEANTGSLEGSSPVVLSMTEINPAGWGTIGLDNSAGGGLYSATAFPLNVTAVPSKAIWPYVQQWSFSVEHTLPQNTLASVAYVGSKGTHLTAEIEANQLTPYSAAQNPFAPQEPLRTRGSNPAVGSGSATGDCTVDPTGLFTLTNGTTLKYGDPAYSNIVTACYQSIGGVNNLSGPTLNTLSPNSLRTYAPGIGEIYSLQNVANSTYEAFQATVRKVQGAFTLGAAYTYSHSLDNASDRSDSTFVNSFDLKSNRASSNFDQRHLLHVSYIYTLPLRQLLQPIVAEVDSDPNPENGTPRRPGSDYLNSKVAKSLIDNWQLSGLTIFETGIPFTVVNNGSPTGISTLDNAGVANGAGSGSYPDLSGISPHSQVPAGGRNNKSFGPLLLNPAAYIAPRGLTFGNAGRNSLNNPNRWNWDMALQKNFPFFEHVDAEFRMEAFNLFNHTQFRIYDPTLGNQAENEISCYGGPVAYFSAAGGDGVDCLTGSSTLHPVNSHRPRTVQLAVKLSF